MAVAKPREVGSPAASQTALNPWAPGGLEPPEVLVAGLAPECALRSAGDQGIGGLFEQVDSPLEQLAKLDDLLDQLVRESVRFDAQPGGRFNQLGELGQR